MYKLVAAAVVALAAVVYAFDPLTITAGSTAYVLTGTQVAVAVASLGALALAAEGLVLAEISRGKRAVDDVTVPAGSHVRMEALFDAIYTVDAYDCGKLVVCNVMAKPVESLSVDEARVAKLFSRYNGKVDPTHAYSQYQLAAATGAQAGQNGCVAQYSRCPFPADQLSQLLAQ